jgi:hypothetical protein
MAARIPARLSVADGRKFGLTVGSALVVLASIAWWRGHTTTSPIMGTLGGLMLAAGILIPSHLGPVERAWMGLAHVISRVTTPVFLAVVYFGVITPIGLVMRLFGRGTLGARIGPGDSYWVAREPGSRSRRDMERQF